MMLTRWHFRPEENAREQSQVGHFESNILVWILSESEWRNDLEPVMMDYDEVCLHDVATSNIWYLTI